MSKPIVLGLVLWSIALAVHGQQLTGNWTGNIRVAGNELPIVFHFKKDGSGKIDGTWDSPKQHVMNLPYSNVSQHDDSLLVEIKVVNGSYRGQFSGADSITGIWSQNGYHLPLNFHRTAGTDEATTAITRSPLPEEKEISITSAGGTQLYGTLLSKDNSQPLVIIIAGSGPTDRNGNSTISAPTNEYQMLADSLHAHGIASFRYDKRGIAKSSSADVKEKDLVFGDYVADAVKIFRYMHDTLGFRHIYLAGHSEGSLIAILASEKTRPQGCISIAGAGRPIDQVLEEQMNKQPLPDSVKQQVPQIFNQLKSGHEVTNYPQELAPLFRQSIQPYMISWLKYDPQQEINKLKCPVLILQGMCDIQVMQLDANNLHKASSKSKLDMIPDMSHTLKSAGPGCVDETQTYSDGSLPVDAKLVEDIVGFIGTGKRSS